MKIIKSFFLFLFIVNLSLSQDFSIPFRKGNFWGYANEKGTILIEPTYDSVSFNSDNLRWYVYKNGKSGIINNKGIVNIAPEYDSIYRNPVHSTYNEFIVYKNGLVGYTNILGEFILPITYKTITKAEDESFNRLELKFFVKKTDSNLYQLIDETRTVLLDSIQNFENLYRGNYIVSTKNKQGIFNLILKKWKINPEYDSISRFQYLDYYRPKKEYENIKYYGCKNSKIFLFSESFEVIATNQNEIQSFFYKPTNEETNFYETVSSVESVTYREIIDINYLNNIKNHEFKTIDFYKTKLKILITKENDKYTIKTNSFIANTNKIQSFDEIKLFKSSYHEEYDARYALVKNKKKWYLFSIQKNEYVSHSSFDSFEFDKKFDSILLLKDKNKIGIFKFDNPSNQEPYVFIEPQYDRFVSFKYIQSNDRNYNYFNLFIFLKDNKLCPIGENGILFFNN